MVTEKQRWYREQYALSDVRAHPYELNQTLSGIWNSVVWFVALNPRTFLSRSMSM